VGFKVFTTVTVMISIFSEWWQNSLVGRTNALEEPASSIFCSEGGSSRFLWSTGTYPPHYAESHPRRE